jgi:hypothetical protein
VYRIRSVLRECIYIVQTKIADFMDAFWVFKQALNRFQRRAVAEWAGFWPDECAGLFGLVSTR